MKRLAAKPRCEPEVAIGVDFVLRDVTVFCELSEGRVIATHTIEGKDATRLLAWMDRVAARRGER